MSSPPFPFNLPRLMTAPITTSSSISFPPLPITRVLPFQQFPIGWPLPTNNAPPTPQPINWQQLFSTQLSILALRNSALAGIRSNPLNQILSILHTNPLSSTTSHEQSAGSIPQNHM